MPITNKTHIEDIFGREFLALPEKKQFLLQDRAFDYWRSTGFPYAQLTKTEIYREYLKLERANSRALLSQKMIASSTVGLRLANAFHPQIWHVPSQNHSHAPIDHFQDDVTLKKLLLRAAKFWPDRRCWQGYNIRNIFSIYSGGRVSNFRPTASKAIIETFSRDDAQVLDFCSGFGGRFLGASALRRHYTGIDASHMQIKGVKKMYAAINGFSKGTAEFHHGCAEDVLPTLFPNSYDLIFTSPPYFNLERYCTTKGQSYIKYASYEEWKNKFLLQTVKQCHRLLKQKGFFVINIADINNYTLAKDFEKLSSKYFTLFAKYSLKLNARPVQRKNGKPYKSEPIYILKKR